LRFLDRPCRAGGHGVIPRLGGLLGLVAVGGARPIMTALGSVDVPCIACLALLAPELAALERPRSGIRPPGATRSTVSLAAGTVLLVLPAVGLRLFRP